VPAGRPLGFLRNLGALRRRGGVSGTLELLGARAFPRIAFYRRTAVVAAVPAGKLSPELNPRRLIQSDGQIEELHARLAASGEPEVPAFTPEMLRRRFAEGYQLWLFHIDGEVAHLRWLAPPRVRFEALSVPVAPGDRVVEAAVTLPGFRGHRLNDRCDRHVQAVLAGEGAERIVSVINAFNRNYLAATLAREWWLLAMVHEAGVAGWRWVRVEVTAPGEGAPFEAAGVSTRRWTRHPQAA
jgi:hypothetical protein